MLIPISCAACGALGAAVCRRCAAELRPAPNLPPPPGVDRCVAVLAYDGVARDVVARIKYRNHRAAIDGLAAAMASAVTGAPPQVVTWAPTTDARRRERGFDHAELLARAVAARLGVPAHRLLRRRPGPPQTGRALAARLRGPDLAPAAAVHGAHVLVVDDVVTSGATATAAAAALRRAGARTVTFLAAARTPPPSRAQERHPA